MMYERRIVASLQDIKALIFQCNQCKSRTAMSPDDWTFVPKQCPNGHHWAINTGKIFESGFMPEAFLASLRNLRDPAYEQSGFKIFLEFEDAK